MDGCSRAPGSWLPAGARPRHADQVRGTLLFDGRCGFCTRSVGWLARLDRHHRVTAIPNQSPGAAERYRLTPARLAESVWWIGLDGVPRSGAEAVNHALAAALGTRLPVLLYLRVPGMRRLQEAVYRWVAANRHRLPGTTPWCTRHPADCAAPSTG